MRFLTSARLAFWGPVALALLMVALTLVPADVWKAPAVDASYSGFDSNLVAVTGGAPDSVVISSSSMDLVSTPDAQPSVNLATTQLAKLTASMDVVIVANSGALQPFRIGVWSPWTSSGQFVVFGPGPQNVIVSESISNGRPAASLVGGDITDSRVLGRYQIGAAYHVALSVDRAARSIKV